MRIRVPFSAVVATALAVTVAACGSGGGDTNPSSSTGSNTLTVYSALPLNGTPAEAAASQAIVNGEKLALQQANGRAGDYTVRYVSLDDAPKDQQIDPGTVADNARRAVLDRSTIAYLGDKGDDESKLSIPVLNEAGILQVSPSNQYVGLTTLSKGSGQGEPDKFYPSGRRTFGRVIPSDAVQAAAQARYQQDQGCTSTYVVSDSSSYGEGLAKLVAADLQSAGITVAGNEPIDPEDDDAVDEVSRKIQGSGANCVFYGGSDVAQGAALFRQVHAANPRVKLFAPSTLSTPAFARAVGSAGAVTFVTTPYLEESAYPPASKRFFADYRKAYGTDPGPEAIYGYEAMSATLQAIRDAGSRGNDRKAVVDAFFGIRDRESVLGTYSIDEHGDTTLKTYGGERVEGGKLVFDKVITTD